MEGNKKPVIGGRENYDNWEADNDKGKFVEKALWDRAAEVVNFNASRKNKNGIYDV